MARPDYTGMDVIIVRGDKIAALYVFLDSMPSCPTSRAGDVRQRGGGAIPCLGGLSGGISVVVVFPELRVHFRTDHSITQ
jgi:hypothetical protein